MIPMKMKIVIRERLTHSRRCPPSFCACYVAEDNRNLSLHTLLPERVRVSKRNSRGANDNYAGCQGKAIGTPSSRPSSLLARYSPRDKRTLCVHAHEGARVRQHSASNTFNPSLSGRIIASSPTRSLPVCPSLPRKQKLSSACTRLSAVQGSQ